MITPAVACLLCPALPCPAAPPPAPATHPRPVVLTRLQVFGSLRKHGPLGSVSMVHAGRSRGELCFPTPWRDARLAGSKAPPPAKWCALWSTGRTPCTHGWSPATGLTGLRSCALLPPCASITPCVCALTSICGGMWRLAFLPRPAEPRHGQVCVALLQSPPAKPRHGHMVCVALLPQVCHHVQQQVQIHLCEVPQDGGHLGEPWGRWRARREGRTGAPHTFEHAGACVPPPLRKARVLCVGLARLQAVSTGVLWCVDRCPVEASRMQSTEIASQGTWRPGAEACPAHLPLPCRRRASRCCSWSRTSPTAPSPPPPTAACACSTTPTPPWCSTWSTPGQTTSCFPSRAMCCAAPSASTRCAAGSAVGAGRAGGSRVRRAAGRGRGGQGWAAAACGEPQAAAWQERAAVGRVQRGDWPSAFPVAGCMLQQRQPCCHD